MCRKPMPAVGREKKERTRSTKSPGSAGVWNVLFFGLIWFNIHFVVLARTKVNFIRSNEAPNFTIYPTEISKASPTAVFHSFSLEFFVSFGPFFFFIKLNQASDMWTFHRFINFVPIVLNEMPAFFAVCFKFVDGNIYAFFCIFLFFIHCPICIYWITRTSRIPVFIFGEEHLCMYLH